MKDRGDGGFAVLFMMAVILLSAVLISGAHTIASASKGSALAQNQQMQCYYIAQAGLEQAMAVATVTFNTPLDRITTMSAPISHYVQGETAGGAYDVSVERVSSNRYRFKCNATLGDISKYLEITLQADKDLDFSKGILLGSSFVDANPGSAVQINSDVYVQGDLTAAKVDIAGSLSATGNIKLYGATVGGSVKTSGGGISVLPYTGPGARGSVVGDLNAAGSVLVQGKTGSVTGGGEVTVVQESPDTPSRTGNIDCPGNKLTGAGVSVSGSIVNSVSTEGDIILTGAEAGNLLACGQVVLRGSSAGNVSSRGDIWVSDEDAGSVSGTASLYSGGDILVDNGTLVSGSTWGRNIVLQNTRPRGTTRVTGYLYASSSIMINNARYLGLYQNYPYIYNEGYIYSNKNIYTPLVFPEFEDNYENYLGRAQVDHRLYADPDSPYIEIKNNAEPPYRLQDMQGIYIIDTEEGGAVNLGIQGCYTQPVVLVVNGDVNVTGPLYGTPPGGLAIIASGRLTVTGDTDLYPEPWYIRALIYARGKVSIDRSTDIWGGLIAGSLEIKGGMSFTPDVELTGEGYLASKIKPPFTVIRKERFPVLTPF